MARTGSILKSLARGIEKKKKKKKKKKKHTVDELTD